MKQLVIGMMSGTSLDGIDIALVAIEEANGMQDVTFLYGETYPYPTTLIPKIRSIIDPNTCTAALISSVHFELAEAYASVVQTVLDSHQLERSNIELIASHGQTIYHIDGEEGYRNSSLQLGDGSVLSTITGIPVVSNFRNADIAAGGTGAPLVPFADYMLFGKHGKSILLQNIGGIGNVTCFKEGQNPNVLAFDTGPGNVLINEAMELLYHKPYDEDGKVAASGQIQERIVETILAHPYFQKQPPKSTGREVFGRHYVKSLLDQFHDVEHQDIIASFTYATARSMVDAYQRYCFPDTTIDTVVISGGGIYNQTLLDHIQRLLPEIRIQTTSDYGVSGDYKEAIAFAMLGHETMHHRPSNVPSATGADKHVILGQISIPLKEES